MTTARRYLLVVESVKGDPVPAVVRLRYGLKLLGRSCRLRCVQVREVEVRAEEPAVGDAAPVLDEGVAR